MNEPGIIDLLSRHAAGIRLGQLMETAPNIPPDFTRATGYSMFMNSPGLCPKCGSTMEEGFILDVTHGAQLVSRWVAGKPEPSFWTGAKIRGKEQHKIQTFRCSSCGFLESYARLE